MNVSEQQAELCHLLSHLGERVRANASLAEYTTFGIGGPALVLAHLHTVAEVEDAIRAAHDVGVPIVSIGQGSNLLIADAGVHALVFMLGGDFSAIVKDEEDATVVTAGAAVKLPVLARQTVGMGLSGLEWAVGVPGSVGGGVRMNAGGHGSDMAANLIHAVVASTATISGNNDNPGNNTERREARSLKFGYRSSAIADSDVVLNATFRLAPGDVVTGETELREIVRWRREHQPGGANCGSVFTNPPADSAGRLIDAAGLKGHRIGTAQVSTKHANFIQADPGATAQDVSALIVYVQTVVFDRFQIRLHAEVKTLGVSTYQRVS